MSQCPHLNRDCRTGNQCGPCSGGIVRDGERVIAPMMMRDGVPRELIERGSTAIRNAITDDVRAQARADHEQWRREQQHRPAGVNDTRARGCTIDAHHAQAISDNLVSGQRTLAIMRDDAARVQAYADHYSEQQAARDAAMQASPRDSAYAAMCNDLQRGRAA